MKTRNKIIKTLAYEVKEAFIKTYEYIKGKRFSDLDKDNKENLKALLKSLYWNYNLSLRKIALLFKRDYDTIYQWFIKFSIKKRSHLEAQCLRRNPDRRRILDSLPNNLQLKIEVYKQLIKPRKVNIPFWLLKQLYLNYKLSTYKIAILFGVSRETVSKLLRRFRIKTRLSVQKRVIDEKERESLLQKVPVDIRRKIDEIYKEFKRRKSLGLPISSEKIPKKILEYLYLKCKLSLKEIAILFGLGVAKIQKRLEKYNIPRRSISEALTKYPKTSFIEDSKEMTKFKCYLLGARCGDLYTLIDGRRVVCTVSTTHPAWEKLMNGLFGKFGPVRRFPFENRKGTYAWRISTYLNESFSFLVSKLIGIPSWIANDKQLFFNFLAGLIDSDGTITLKGKDRPCIKITTTDKWLVQEIKDILENFNCHPTLYKKEKHGKAHFGKKPVYALEIGKKKEVMELLSQIPFRHEEKMKRAILALKLRKEPLIKAWKELRDEIKNRRTTYQELARITIKARSL